MKLTFNPQIKATQGFNKKALLGALLAAGIVMASGNAAADTDTQSLTVSADIGASCIFGAAASLPFGTLSISDLTAGKSETTPATVTITCTNTNAGAKFYAAATREMAGTGPSAGDTLDYEVYTDVGRTTALGSNLATGMDMTANGTEQTVLLYGKTAAGQNEKLAGNYSQSLLMTVEF